MHDDAYTLILAPLLGWLAVGSVLFVGYLAWLEIAERRRHRRLEQKREELTLSNPYHPKVPRRLAFQMTIPSAGDTTICPKFRQAFLKLDRQKGWSRTATGLN